jgi:hypothetical protein
METYAVTMDGHDFASWSCPKCDADIDVEEEMMSVCNEPFNGTIINCPNEECGAEFDCELRFRIVEL